MLALADARLLGVEVLPGNARRMNVNPESKEGKVEVSDRGTTLVISSASVLPNRYFLHPPRFGNTAHGARTSS